MIRVRPAAALDTRAMAALLNAIIEKGGTTALTRPVTGADMSDWIKTPSSHWHVAETQTGEIKGFQWIAPRSTLPQKATDIATFVEIGQTGLGIGSTLFDATAKAARMAGYEWINASIRADNESGLAYYQSRGFRIYDRLTDVDIGGGLRVDKILKRYDLD